MPGTRELSVAIRGGPIQVLLSFISRKSEYMVSLITRTAPTGASQLGINSLNTSRIEILLVVVVALKWSLVSGWLLAVGGSVAAMT